MKKTTIIFTGEAEAYGSDEQSLYMMAASKNTSLCGELVDMLIKETGMQGTEGIRLTITLEPSPVKTLEVVTE